MTRHMSAACPGTRVRRVSGPGARAICNAIHDGTQVVVMDEANSPAESSTRVGYLDNIRVFLTALVVLHHFAITYGASGWWFYVEQPVDGLTGAILFPFVAINQAYFMGFFFLISAYFLPGSLHRKGRSRFLSERLRRLGIPLVVYFFLLNPLVFGIAALASGDQRELIWRTIENDPLALVGTGPMWFVAFLLLLTLAYLVLPDRSAATAGKPRLQLTVANTTVFALGLGLVSFLIRTIAPIGTWIEYLVEPAHAPQYAGLFGAGIVAGKLGWEGEIPVKVRRYWACMLPISFVLAWGFLAMILGAEGDPARAMGGVDAASLVYAMWEHLWCIGIIVLLLAFFQRRLAGQGPWLQAAALDSYATYILHPLVIVALAVSLQSLPTYPLLKFLILAPVAVVASFAVGHLARKLPGARRVL